MTSPTATSEQARKSPYPLRQAERNADDNSSPLAGEEGARRKAVGRRGGKRSLLTHAKRMRRDPTEAERTLWSLIRAKRVGGLKFRRQEQIGDYIIDFVCFGQRLVVEVDGSQHADSTSDIVRDKWLATQGFRVLRFWNSDVAENPDGVAEAIVEAASSSNVIGKSR